VTTYRLRNIDCPACAAGLEQGLRKVSGVRAVSIDFGSLSMKVDASDLAAVETAVKELEPMVGFVRLAGLSSAANAKAETDFELRREVPPLVLATAAGTVGLVLVNFVSWKPAASMGLGLLAFAYLVSGWGVLLGAARNMLRGKFFDELFLMGIATIGAIAIGQYEEAVGVMVFYSIGETLQRSAASRSRASIRSLLDLRPDFARLRRAGLWTELPPEEAFPGDEFLVKPGERLPLDGRVVEGEAFIDTSALTGESLPRRAFPGAEVLAGSVSIDGALVVSATRAAGESSAARIASMVENAAHMKARSERWVTRFAAIYTPIVVAMAAAIAFLPPLLIPGQSLREWVYRALVMLVISCPCALVVSVPLGYFGGIGGAARRGILVKGAQVFDALAECRAVAFDKTGTLTSGKLVVRSIEAEQGWKAEEILAWAAAAESLSRHPIASSLRAEAEARGVSIGTEDEASEVREIPGAGIAARIGGKRVLAGNDRLMQIEGVEHPMLEAEDTLILVAVDGRYAGSISLGDGLKDDAKRALSELRALGLGRIAMLTGDSASVAQRVADELGIEETYAELLPEGKLEALSKIIAELGPTGGKTIFVGDGVNDAPVLALADVGVAMGAGSDAAVETADIVLLTDEPSRVAEAISRARRTRAIVTQNIVFALGIKAAFLAMGAAGVAVMWEAVIADVGVALLAVANSLRAMK
jgi:Cd2+/Zn2+-exporting ATPase